MLLASTDDGDKEKHCVYEVGDDYWLLTLSLLRATSPADGVSPVQKGGGQRSSRCSSVGISVYQFLRMKSYP